MIKTFIRVDSSEEMGTGHLMRSLTLAGELRERGVPVIFICRRLPGALYGCVEKKGFTVYLLSAPPRRKTYWEWARKNRRQDAEETKEIIEEHREKRKTGVSARARPVSVRAALPPEDRDGVDTVVDRLLTLFDGCRKREEVLLVVDHYALDTEWEKLLRPVADRIMVIDDLADRAHDCDILLDQNYYQNRERRYEGLVPPHCLQFLGPGFALLRPEFREARRNLRRQNGKIR